jgi:outer membrane protein assembly factor BamE (lipoprotein component of BamABCDE complex)
MVRSLCLLALACLMAGCGSPYANLQQPDVFEVCQAEQAKLGKVRVGMTEAQVAEVMGPAYLRIFNGERYEYESRPHRREEKKLRNGWTAVVLYYRARVLHHDSLCTTDETEAVLLINGKVDTVIHGDAVESFLSKF